ncbi:MAG: hypothetical protein LBP50_02845 [Tannerella sp.]|jgi:hypothetical protein|nr:hypothetical protein [Tannerella sp.]
MPAPDNFLRRIVGDYFRFAVNFFRTASVYRKKYTSQKAGNHTPSLVVFFVDGAMIHGGLGDRLKGIISAYAVCKAKSLPFRICFDHPFMLQDYLVPNRYDWITKPDERIVFSKKCAKIINVHNYPQSNALFRIPSSSSIQYHVYGNMNILERINERFATHFQWADLFDELFRPSALLAESIREHIARIGGDYVTLHFRFQQLLGDFCDPDGETLPLSRREWLIRQCLDYVAEQQKLIPSQILVLSDSHSFIKRVEEQAMEKVHTLPGNVVHMDYAGSGDGLLPAHLKTFLDFFMLRHAIKAVTVVADRMRISEFPLYAALSAGIPHETVHLV